MAPDESADVLINVMNRLEALDRKLEDRFAALDRKLDAGFAAVDTRLEQVDTRFKQIDMRFDTEHSHFQALSEASRSDFKNLYDFVTASAVATNARFDQLDADLATRFADVYAAIAAVTQR